MTSNAARRAVDGRASTPTTRSLRRRGCPRPRERGSVAAATLAAAVALAACHPPDGRTSAAVDRDFAPRAPVISVLGAYRDGRMDTEAWWPLGQRLARAWGIASCEPAYTEALVRDHRELAAAIDDYARANGPTDELLGRLAPAAAGQYVLVVSVAGRAAAKTGVSVAREEQAKAQRARGAAAPVADANRDELDVAASFYSVAERRSVALVTIRYSGASSDDALSQFTAKVSGLVPGARCGGWSFGGAVDASSIPRVEERE